MLKYILLGLIAIASLVNVNLAKKPEEWGDDDFNQNLQKHGKAFVKFYAPWCGHCKRLAPTWDELADTVEDGQGAVVKIDCTTKGAEVCKLYDIRGYPTLKYFKYNNDDAKNHKVIDYNGARDKSNLLGFAKKHGSPLYKELSDKEIGEFLKNDVETTFVLFTKSKDTKAFKEFERVADTFVGTAQFGVSFTKNPSAVFPKASPESMVFQRAQQLITNVESDKGVEADIEKFVDFVKYSLHGRVALREPSNDETIPRTLVTVFIASSFKTNSSFFKMIRNRLFPVAEKYPDVQFAIAASSDFAGYIESVGFDQTKDELLFTIDDAEHKRFVPKLSIKFNEIKTLPDLLNQFLTEYTAGRLTVFYKSEPIPEEQKAGLPMVLVAKNFNSVIADKTKNVFVKMYAPWCGHCKKMAPFWDELADKYKDDQSIIIAKFDAIANDIPNSDYDITGFPTLFFSKAGSTEKPIQYSGGRTLEAFVQFVEKHTSKVQDSKDEL